MSEKSQKKLNKKDKKFKVVIGYPPIQTGKGVPLLSQNRQFQYFNAKTYIYPMVPAYAATVAQEAVTKWFGCMGLLKSRPTMNG